MKIPACLIGMIVAGVAAPLVAGCAAETETPAPVAESRAELGKKPDSTEPTDTAEPKAPTPTATTPDASTGTATEPTEEDPCPPCGMG
jgi:hypothetical protein